MWITTLRAREVLTETAYPRQALWNSTEEISVGLQTSALERASRRLDMLPLTIGSNGLNISRFIDGHLTDFNGEIIQDAFIPKTLETGVSYLAVLYTDNPLGPDNDIIGQNVNDSIHPMLVDLPLSVQTAIWPYLDPSLTTPLELQVEQARTERSETRILQREKALPLTYIG